MRTQTTKLIDMMDEGLISATAVAEMCLAYMSEDDVKDMMLANDIIEDDYDDEDLDPDFDLEPEVDEWPRAMDYEDDGQPSEAQEWESFDPDC
jgi:hypothetical protein